MIMFFAVLNKDGWDWLFVFLFVACAVMRLARFNVEQAGRAKRYFHGLPSPAAGMTLATYYWFSQTSLYSETNIGDLPWHVMMRFIMLGLSYLMISNVSYPAVPTVGFRKISEILGSLVVLGTFLGVLFLPKEFFFPALMLYVLYGLIKTVLFGLMGRGPAGDVPVIADDDELEMVMVKSEGMSEEQRRRRRRRRRHGGSGDRPHGPPTEGGPA
jgi:CDP-diacylglycerol--serine O-phosphatidyltransferase